MIGQQVENAIALVSNGNIEEGMHANVKVGETYATTNVCKIEIHLHKTIDMIEHQEIVVLGQENANGDVEPHVQIDEGEILYLPYYN